MFITQQRDMPTERGKTMKKHLLAALVAALVVLSGCTVTPPGETPQQPAPAETSAETAETPAEPSEPAAPTLKYGELLDVQDHRDAAGMVVVKGKISPSTTNALTVAQNYHNAVDLIANQGFSGCELQYWAVADMSDGSEGKVISFTVPADVVDRVAAGEVVATQLPDLVTDLWILPSLAG